MKEFGKIDILVNVAGINARFAAEEMPAEEFEKVIRFNIARHLPALPGRGQGHDRAEEGQDRQHGLGARQGRPLHRRYRVRLQQGRRAPAHPTLAAEWAKYGINVNAIAPALVMTDMTREFLSKPEIYSKMTAEIPLARLGVPEDLLGPIILLASDASDFITGQIIYVDGGLSAV